MARPVARTQVITKPGETSVSSPLPHQAQAYAEPVAAPEPAARPVARQAVRQIPGDVPTFVGPDGRIHKLKRLSNEDIFFVPEHLKDPAYSYEWKREEVYGRPDTSHQVYLAENSWEPVLVTRNSPWSGVFMPGDYEGPIRRDGQILMTRLKEITDYVRALEKQKADDLVRSNNQRYVRRQAIDVPAGFSADHAGVTPNISQSYEPGPAPTRRPMSIE